MSRVGSYPFPWSAHFLLQVLHVDANEDEDDEDDEDYDVHRAETDDSRLASDSEASYTRKSGRGRCYYHIELATSH